MTRPASVLRRAILRGRVAFVALSFGTIAAMIAAVPQPHLASVLVRVCVVVMASATVWEIPWNQSRGRPERDPAPMTLPSPCEAGLSRLNGAHGGTENA
jgi:hypothetical protein